MTRKKGPPPSVRNKRKKKSKARKVKRDAKKPVKGFTKSGRPRFKEIF